VYFVSDACNDGSRNEVIKNDEHKMNDSFDRYFS